MIVSYDECGLVKLVARDLVGGYLMVITDPLVFLLGVDDTFTRNLLLHYADRKFTFTSMRRHELWEPFYDCVYDAVSALVF